MRASIATAAAAASLWLVATVSFDGTARGDEPDPAWQVPSSKEEIVDSLREVSSKYGPDTVMLQAYLLNEALRLGSILETSISAPSTEEREERTYLALSLDSGLVFNDRDTTQTDRVTRVWREIVERTLRRYESLQLPADGVAIGIGYDHKTFASDADLRAGLQKEGRGQRETVAFYLLGSDVGRFLARELSAQELLDRSYVLLDDRPYVLRLPSPPGAEPEPASQ
jgi:hypothetical protein